MKGWDIFTGEKAFKFSCDMGKDVGMSVLDVDKVGKKYTPSHLHSHLHILYSAYLARTHLSQSSPTLSHPLASDRGTEWTH